MIKEKDVLDVTKNAEHCFIITEKGLYIVGSPVVIAKQTILKLLSETKFRDYMKIYLTELRQFTEDFKKELEEKDNDRK